VTTFRTEDVEVGTVRAHHNNVTRLGSETVTGILQSQFVSSRLDNFCHRI